MIMKYASLSFLLLLPLVMHAHGSGAKENSVLRLHSMDGIDISQRLFFTFKDLNVGNSMPIYFAKRESSKPLRFLSREEADSIPFSSKQLPEILGYFGFSPGSPKAKAMESSLRLCESPADTGETRFCATSLESMLDSARHVFGSNVDFKVLRTKYLTKSSTLFQNYTISKIAEQIPATAVISCHTKPYAYPILYCHRQLTETRVFMVSLSGENGDRVTSVAVCHMDTTQWSHNHFSFRLLGIEPWTPGVCHFYPDDNFVLVANT